MLDYGFRYYMPEIGRFSGVDPIADQFPHVTVYNYAENRVPVGIDLWGLQFAPPPIPSLPEGSPPRFHERFPNYSFQPKNIKNNDHQSKERGGFEVVTGYGPAAGTMSTPSGTSNSVIDELYPPSSASKDSWFMGFAESIANLTKFFKGVNTGEAKSPHPDDWAGTSEPTPQVTRVKALEDPKFRTTKGVDTVTVLSEVTYTNDSTVIQNEQFERRHDGKTSKRQPLKMKNKF